MNNKYIQASERAVAELLRRERDSVPNTMMLAAARASHDPEMVIQQVICATTYNMLDPNIRRRAEREPFLRTVATAINRGRMALTPGF